MPAPIDSNWLWGIGGSVAGTVVGGLVLRGLGLGVLNATLQGMQKRLDEVVDRLDRLEAPLIQRGYSGPDRRSAGREK